MPIKYNMKKLFTFLLFLSLAVQFFAVSKAETYDSLMQNGTVTDIKKALLVDNDMITVRLGEDKNTLLMQAIEYGRPEPVISLLLKAGLSVNSKNKNGQDSLMYICKYSQDPNLIKLIFSKAGSENSLKKKLKRKDKNGLSAYDYAKENRGPQASYLVKKYVSDKEMMSDSTQIAEAPKEEKETKVPAKTQKLSKAQLAKQQDEEAEKAKQERIEAARKAKEEAALAKAKAEQKKEEIPDIKPVTEKSDTIAVKTGNVSFNPYDDDFEDDWGYSYEQEETAGKTEKQELAQVDELKTAETKTEKKETKPTTTLTFDDDDWDWFGDDEGFFDDPVPQTETAQNATTEETPETVESVTEQQVEIAENKTEQESLKIEPEKAIAKTDTKPEEDVVVVKSNFKKKNQPTFTPPEKNTAAEPVKKEEKAPVEVAKAEAESQNTKTEAIKLPEEEPVKFSIPKTSPSIAKYQKTYLYDFAPKEEPVKKSNDTGINLATISDPDAKDKDGRTALMKAVKAGNDWEIRSLLKSGANVNLQDNEGWTAMMYACRYQNNLEIVNMLLQYKADTQICNNYGTNALSLAACYSNNPAIVKRIINSYPIGNGEIFKAFVLAINSSTTNTMTQIAKLQVFIDKNIEINRFYEGKTPLMYAAEYATSTEIIELLLDNGAQTAIRSTQGKTAFDYAEFNSQLEHNDVYWALNKR